MLEHRLVELELFEKVKVGALAVHVLLDDAFHALLLETVRHIVERVLVRDRYQHLGADDGSRTLDVDNSTPIHFDSNFSIQ